MNICKTVILGFVANLICCMGVQADPVNILFFGDSLTAGYQLPKEQAYPEQVAILAKEAGKEVVVHNAGVSGDTTSSGLSRLNWNLRRPFDMFVLALGANDGLRGIDLTLTQQNLRTILQRVKEHNPNAVLVVAGMKLPPNYGLKYRRQFEKMYAEVAKEFDALLIPFLLEGVGGVPELNLSDGIHPNAEGHKRVAKTVWEIIAPAL